MVASGRFVAYPNPYKPSKHANSGITFAGLKRGAEIKIFNIAGELVFEAKTPADGAFVWNASNSSGNQAASGVYIYHIKSGGKTYKGKVAVER
jgi:flagellar hook assembly protein FlgD